MYTHRLKHWRFGLRKYNKRKVKLLCGDRILDYQGPEGILLTQRIVLYPMPHRALYLNQDYENSSHLCELVSGKVLAFLFLFLFIFHNDHCFLCFLSSHFLPLSPFYLPPHPHLTIHSSCLHSERGRPAIVSTKHGTGGPKEDAWIFPGKWK